MGLLLTSYQDHRAANSLVGAGPVQRCWHRVLYSPTMESPIMHPPPPSSSSSSSPPSYPPFCTPKNIYIYIYIYPHTNVNIYPCPRFPIQLLLTPTCSHVVHTQTHTHSAMAQEVHIAHTFSVEEDTNRVMGGGGFWALKREFLWQGRGIKN